MAIVLPIVLVVIIIGMLTSVFYYFKFKKGINIIKHLFNKKKPNKINVVEYDNENVKIKNQINVWIDQYA